MSERRRPYPFKANSTTSKGGEYQAMSEGPLGIETQRFLRHNCHCQLSESVIGVGQPSYCAQLNDWKFSLVTLPVALAVIYQLCHSSSKIMVEQ